MKWLALAALAIAVWPASAWLRARIDRLVWPCFLIGLLPFVTQQFHLLSAPISWVGRIGYVTGFEIWVVDFVALTILISLRGRLVRPPFMIPMAMYFVAVLVASLTSQFTEASLFYCWQLLRVFLIFYAVTNVCALEFAAVAAILKGLAAGELVECAVALTQRFGHHVLQTPGTLGSQNELGMASHFVILPFFAITLGGRRGWLPAVVVLAGLLVDALTASRGSVSLVLTGLFLVWLFSSFSKFSARKFGIAVFGLMALSLIAPLALTSFETRFARSNLGLAEDGERLAFKRAAWMMLADHPGGVGPNNFAMIGNIGGYYTRARGVSAGGRGGNVHNVFILIWAETGPAGLICYLLMFVAPLAVSLKYGAMRGRRDHDDPERDILIGASVVLVILCLHSTEEWVTIGGVLQYLLAILFGLIAGLTAEGRAAKAGRRLASYRGTVVPSLS